MNESKTLKVVIFEWASLAALVIGCFMFLYNQIDGLDQKIDRQSTRTDRLYEMFCSLQSQMKDELLTMKKEHYDFMKDTKK